LGRTLKSNPNFSAMKLIMMTSMDRSGDAQYFADLGFDGYFPKPVTTSDLFDALLVIAKGGDVLTQAKPLVTEHFVRSLSEASERSDQNKWPKNTRLLLAEDNQINQQVAKDIIENLGLTLDIAGNGLEALHTLRLAEKEDCFSLVLMDCQMPEMDGYEASRAIRDGKAGKNYQNIPIIAMTANAMKGDRENCLDAGMSDYMSKPVEPEVVEQLLKKWLLAPQSTMNVITGEKLTEQFEKAWDQTSVLKRLGGKTERLCKLAIMYLDSMPAVFQTLQQAIVNRNYQEVSNKAHEIKGTAANLGADRVRKFCEDTERAAKDKNDILMDRSYADLYGGHEEFVAEIKNYLSSPPPKINT
ncbi:MAG: response regulator, partial [Pseudomonadales bacterium]|nr:response regulator [Pseudomonadales bacterium]